MTAQVVIFLHRHMFSAYQEHSLTADLCKKILLQQMLVIWVYCNISVNIQTASNCSSHFYRVSLNTWVWLLWWWINKCSVRVVLNKSSRCVVLQQAAYRTCCSFLRERCYDTQHPWLPKHFMHSASTWCFSVLHCSRWLQYVLPSTALHEQNENLHSHNLVWACQSGPQVTFWHQ